MNLEKAKKRIAKHVNKGFKGYPLISLTYYGDSKDVANAVVISFTAEENEEVQEQRFASATDVREDEVIQTTLLKIIERANACSVVEAPGVAPLNAGDD
ncbi:hypothetical protein CA267_008230 [Alteromonas pelagimontana]|uniref:Uncharacterized protein n=1 Tax=Alteromonas pelagimontana TaxID=1858656 RepID=A0A6M4MI24_9ALTE|nr:hypothetical protein [Alteromonas pelagimontana]QJR82789.1 hypothetical protein CA267_008230 [Alteromonas pelagimontana]